MFPEADKKRPSNEISTPTAVPRPAFLRFRFRLAPRLPDTREINDLVIHRRSCGEWVHANHGPPPGVSTGEQRTLDLPIACSARINHRNSGGIIFSSGEHPEKRSRFVSRRAGKRIQSTPSPDEIRRVENFVIFIHRERGTALFTRARIPVINRLFTTTVNVRTRDRRLRFALSRKLYPS